MDNLKKLKKQFSKSLTNLSKSVIDIPKKLKPSSKRKDYLQVSSSDLGGLGGQFGAQSIASTSSLPSVRSGRSGQGLTGAVGSPSGSRQASEAGGSSRPPSSSSYVSIPMAFATNSNTADIQAAKERKATQPLRTHSKNIVEHFGDPKLRGMAAATRPSSVASGSSDGNVQGFQLGKLSTETLPMAATAQRATPAKNEFGHVPMPPLPKHAQVPPESRTKLLKNTKDIHNERVSGKRGDPSTQKSQANPGSSKTPGSSKKPGKGRGEPSV
jgi:hypothetical protein